MKKLLFPIIFSILFVSGCSSTTPTTKTELIFDTPVTISLYGNYGEEILARAFDLCRSYEQLLSTTIESSEISKLNSNGYLKNASDEVIFLIENSINFSKLTDGAFDITTYPVSKLWDFKSTNPTLPSTEDILYAKSLVNYQNILIDGNTITLKDGALVDLGGIAKGYIADKVADFLKEQGVKKAIINIGGNVLTVGSKTKASGFKIGIQKPFSATQESVAALDISDMSVVTSGPYERNFTIDGVLYHHILDPDTGYPVQTDINSVTIINKSSMVADALSTSCFLLGLEEAYDLISNLDGVEAVFIDTTGEIYTTEGIGTKFPITYFE